MSRSPPRRATRTALTASMLQHNVGAQPDRAFAAPQLHHDVYMHQNYGPSDGYGQFQAFDTPSRRQPAQERSAPEPATQAPPPPPPPPAQEPPLGVDNTNRKLLDLPPVVGSTIQFQNKHLKYRPVPDDLDAVRNKLFRVDQDILLNSQQICDYWYHMTNVWQRSTKPMVEHNDTVSEVWECRNRRRVKLVGNAKERKGTGQRNRASKDEILGDVEQCKLRVRVVSYTKHAENPKEPCGPPGFMNCKCVPEWVHMSRTNLTKERNYHHEHEIDMLDRFKRSDAIMYYAKILVEQSYSYSSVHKWLQEKYGSITQEVSHLSKQDVSNVSRYWRLMHKDAKLKSQIEEESDWEQQRKECLDAIHHTSQSQLAKALSEVCRQIPEAVEIIMPFMEKSLEQDESTSSILEAEDIVVPEPGLPKKREEIYAYVRPVLNQQPEPTLWSTHQAPSHSPATAHPFASISTTSISPMQTQADPTRPGQFILSDSSANKPYRVTFTAPATQATPPLSGANASGARTSSNAAVWPPPSVTHPVAQNGLSSRTPGPAHGEWRPTWAQPTPSKRPAGDAPESSSQAPKRTLYEEIRTQLRNELTSITP